MLHHLTRYRVDLVGVRRTDDPRGAVSEQAASQGDGLAAGITHGAEVAEAMNHGQVGDPPCPRQLPVGLHPPHESGDPHHPPSLVVHDQPMA